MPRANRHPSLHPPSLHKPVQSSPADRPRTSPCEMKRLYSKSGREYSRDTGSMMRRLPIRETLSGSPKQNGYIVYVFVPLELGRQG